MELKTLRVSDTLRIADEIRDLGFSVVKNVLQPDDINLVCQTYESILLSRPRYKEQPNQQILEIIPEHRCFFELAMHPLVSDVVASILGSDFICSSFMGHTVHPGCEYMRWHIDHPYLTTLGQSWDPSLDLSVQLIWMLNDFHTTNGATAIIPKSHRWGHPPVDADKWDGERIVIEAPAGSVLFWHGATHHAITPNTTESSRTGLPAVYTRSGIPMMEDNMDSQLSLYGV